MSDDIQWDVEIQAMGLTPLELEAAAGLLQMRPDTDVDIGQREALLKIIEGIKKRGENQLSPEEKKTQDEIYSKLLKSKNVIGGKRKTRKRRRKSRKKTNKKRKKKTNKKRRYKHTGGNKCKCCKCCKKRKSKKKSRKRR